MDDNGRNDPPPTARMNGFQPFLPPYKRMVEALLGHHHSLVVIRR
jgi:hypothetical protein